MWLGVIVVNEAIAIVMSADPNVNLMWLGKRDGRERSKFNGRNLDLYVDGCRA